MPALIDPAERFHGTIIVLAPHMDDEVLACGGTLARIPGKSRIHVVYATDGSRSPAPAVPWRKATPSLPDIRAREALEAMQVLGIPEENVHFLDLPDGRLERHYAELAPALGPLMEALDAAHVLAPFRYDRHPDHLALNRFATAWVQGAGAGAELLEYFVYHRSRLLPRGDIRAYIRPGILLAVDIGPESSAKRAALERYRSQTVRLFTFQARPNLTPAFVDQVCAEPELFLPYSPLAAGAAVLTGPVTWIRVAHRIEPILKEGKDRIVGLIGGGR
jgi:LmbE family N-acetylglucosaminyl deacetylase